MTKPKYTFINFLTKIRDWNFDIFLPFKNLRLNVNITLPIYISINPLTWLNDCNCKILNLLSQIKKTYLNIFSVVAWIPWFVFKSLNLSAGPVFFWSSACNRSEKPGRREFPPVKITLDIRPDRISASHLWTALLNVKFKIFVFRDSQNFYLI